MAHKELLIFLIAHNFLRWIMAEAAQSGAIELERVSFKGCLDAFRQFAQALAQVGHSKNRSKKRDQLWTRFLQALWRDPIPERPGRREPRAVKRRKKYDYLNQARARYRDRPNRHQRAAISRLKRKSALI